MKVEIHFIFSDSSKNRTPLILINMYKIILPKNGFAGNSGKFKLDFFSTSQKIINHKRHKSFSTLKIKKTSY